MSVSLSLIRTGSPPLGTLGLPALQAAIQMRKVAVPAPRRARAVWRDRETRMRRASCANEFARHVRPHARTRSIDWGGSDYPIGPRFVNEVRGRFARLRRVAVCARVRGV